MNLIETESIPSDVGRPPLWLLLREAVGDESIEDLIATAIQSLSRGS